MAHGDAWEGKWRGNCRMECVASTLTLPRNMVHPALLPLMRTPRLPVVYWTDAPADLNGLVCFVERRNLVSACVPSHFKCSLQHKLPEANNETDNNGIRNHLDLRNLRRGLGRLCNNRLCNWHFSYDTVRLVWITGYRWVVHLQRMT
jgi:hypothetical protein